MTTPTIEQFRLDLTEFADTAVFPNSVIQFWLNFAASMVNPNRFLSQTYVGIELFAAHFITLEAQDMLATNAGGLPGTSTGLIKDKEVDTVRIQYDTQAASSSEAGHWNLTSYGMRWLYLSNVFGSGPVQLGMGYTPPLNGPAWPGPDCTPGFSTFGN